MPGRDDAAPVSLDAALTEIQALIERQDGRDRAEPESVADFGRYEGLPPQVAFLEDGRFMQLLSPLAYVRPDGSAWPVPSGIRIDGASIPRAFWTLIGGPFEGRYRNASIVHDHYCDRMTRPWQDTHRMFHEAMRCSGVAAVRAGIMFYAVHRFGPRWGIRTGIGVESMVPPPPRAGDADALSILADARRIIAGNPDLPEIEALSDARRAEAGGRDP